VATIMGGNLPTRQCLKEYRPGAEIKRIANYLGIAMKAGMVAAGDRTALETLKSGRAELVVMASDISPKTAQELLALASKQALPLLWWPDMNSLGLTVGKSRRGAVVIKDKGFTESIIKLCISH